jgi:hypothetical protein
LRLVLQLRSLTLGGEYVHARLKGSTLHQAPTASPLVEAVAAVVAAAAPLEPKKKRRLRGRKKRHQPPTNNGVTTTKHVSSPPLLLSLGKDEFPTLVEDAVAWSLPLVQGRIDQHQEPKQKVMSDGASTDTTTSSSMESLASYAAAVMCNSSVSHERIEHIPTTGSSSADHPASASLSRGKRRSFANVAALQ